MLWRSHNVHYFPHYVTLGDTLHEKTANGTVNITFDDELKILGGDCRCCFKSLLLLPQ